MKGKKSIRKILTTAGIVAFAAVGTATVCAAESTTAKYYSAYESEAEAKEAAIELQTRIAAEGDVLLKNQDAALPLKSNAKISVFGGRQNDVLGASESSGGTSSGSGGLGLCSALSSTGFNVNPTLESFYKNNTTSIGKETTSFSGRVESSLSLYNDAAVVIISREGGEGSDASRVTNEKTDADDFEHEALYKDKDGNAYKHYLMLTNQEEDLIKYVKANFKKVVIVINSSNAMEVDNLKNDEGISAIINIGRPGGGGLYGLAQILNGTVSPSGSLVDEWMRDFTNDPTWYNFGDNNQSKDSTIAEGEENLTGSNTYLYEDKSTTGAAGTSSSHDSEGYHGVDYEEGIYLGYKYYETLYSEIAEGNITYDASAALGSQLSYNAVSTGKTAANIESANAWWKKNVAYQYGYGLTYTDFSFNIAGVFTNQACTATLGTTGLADDFASTAAKAAKTKTLYVKVKVTNTGSVAGKKTVQVYVTAPYTNGGVEKASVSLVGFGKTSKELKPGESENVVVAVNVQDMASYDYKNLSNAVGADGGYVLEKGDYTLRVMDSSHYDYATNTALDTDAYDEYNFSLDKSVELVQDDYSGNEVHNLFTDYSIGSGAYAKDGVGKDSTVNTLVTEADLHDMKFNSIRTADMMADGTSGMTILSRGNMVSTFPKAPTGGDHTFKNSIINYFAYWDQFSASTEYEINGSGYEDHDSIVRNASHDLPTDRWYITDIPSNWTQATGVYEEDHMVENNRTKTRYPMYVSKDATIMFSEMSGVDIDDDKWDLFLNQLTYDELCSVVEFGGYSTVDIKSVGKEQTKDTDGPNNLDGTVAWTSEDILAATFNTDLAYEEGVIMGNIGLLHGVQGWYGPGADTHRSPFSGRNNEYYSQDGLHAGYIGAAEVQGVQSVGVIPYIKHCLMNDMETDRGTMFVWADEQTIRESGAKQFQIILQEGQCKAAMTGYARLCGLNNTNNYNLGVELYQNQWGSNAYFVTDGYIGWRTRTSLDNMVRTGNQMELYTTPFVEYLSGEWVEDATHANGGYVVVEDLADDTNANHLYESKTQWYWVRQSAKAILWQVANSSGQFNGYGSLKVNGGQLNATQGVAFNGSVSINNLLTDGSSVTYSVTGLPQGLSLNAATGAISGTIAAEGTYNFSVNYLIDGWISKSANYTLTVAPAFKFTDDSDDLAAAATNEEFLAVIESSVYNASQYDSFKYSVKSGALPAGLTLSEDGTISGTPTEAGTFTVVIALNASKTTTNTKKGTTSTSYTNDEFTATIVVAGDVTPVDPEPVADPVETAKAELQTQINTLKADLEKASTKTEQDTISAKIAELESQLNELNATPVASNNNSTVLALAIVAMILAVAACGATVFVVLKKKN